MFPFKLTKWIQSGNEIKVNSVDVMHPPSALKITNLLVHNKQMWLGRHIVFKEMKISVG